MNVFFPPSRKKRRLSAVRNSYPQTRKDGTARCRNTVNILIMGVSKEGYSPSPLILCNKACNTERIFSYLVVFEMKLFLLWSKIFSLAFLSSANNTDDGTRRLRYDAGIVRTTEAKCVFFVFRPPFVSFCDERERETAGKKRVSVLS